jgi:hypothetical protein
MRTSAQLLRNIWVVAAAMPLAAGGCRYATPAPPFASARVDSIAFDSIRAYAQGLRFDSVPGAADEKRVAFDTVLPGMRVADAGDSAWIEPERGAWALDTTALAQGRIIARIRTAHFHRAFGYSPRWTWWWVDRKGGAWRSLLLSDSLRRGIRDSLTVITHPGYRWRQSLARWGSQWAVCSESACCEGLPQKQ